VAGKLVPVHKPEHKPERKPERTPAHIPVRKRLWHKDG